MKKSITNLLLMTTLFTFSMVVQLSAQNRTSSEYLKGAVKVEDGEVVFRELFSAPGISRDSLMNITQEWINGRDNPEEERSSRVLIFDEEKGSVVGGCSEKLVFKSALLLLDQADMNYYIHANCSDGAVDMAIIRIRYDYGKDRYTAEEMITDEVSLDKKQMRILKMSEKWRVKTIDFTKDLFKDYNDFLSRNK
ncbi:DUF4468 domain-containing protein [Proteiniphilum sp.]|uniref:DUF4468 domain-containing protein n=1 Tax=Proteiniphilum sp. TaxID=1926877 RepID=UPI002B1E93E7|nr:DUF4468 domain-containing protein [Proteiniphilum sp.]MEA4917127.1 DUF4468 domain-containing protein [Proteiniphilum sp.]